MNTVPIVISFVSAVVFTLMAFITSRRQKREKEEVDKRQKALNDTLRITFNKSLPIYLMKYGGQPIYLDLIKKALRDSLAHSQSLEPKADIKEQANAIVDELKKRIEAIEARFPQEATLEKMSSINDALLAKQLENVGDSVKAIQEKMLTKWDVAKIVFAIFGALGGIIAIIFAILTFV